MKRTQRRPLRLVGGTDVLIPPGPAVVPEGDTNGPERQFARDAAALSFILSLRTMTPTEIRAAAHNLLAATKRERPYCLALSESFAENLLALAAEREAGAA